jgi:RecA/RadA recombinase
MDSSHFLVRQATDITEYRAGVKIRMKGRVPKKKDEEVNPEDEGEGVIIDLEEKSVTGIPASGHGIGMRPWFNWEAGVAGCTCPIFERGNVVFCRHILGLFESLNEDEDKYGQAFLEKFTSDPLYATSIKTTSQSVSTGLVNVDELLMGGIPRSAITAIGGTTKVGKTWFAIQTVFNAIMDEMNVLWIDCENMFKRQDSFGTFEELLRKRYKYKGPVGSRMHIISDSTLQGVGKYFGLDLDVSTSGNKIKVFRTIKQKKDETPIISLCRAKKIDLVVLDSLTNLIKPYIGDTQDLGARRLIIDSLWEPMEALATECDLAFICINHATRNYEFRLYDDPKAGVQGILDAPVDDLNAGIWGASALMYHVKHFIQIENCTRDYCKKKNIKHFMRRLFPGKASSHVDIEFIRDYGFVEF